MDKYSHPLFYMDVITHQYTNFSFTVVEVKYRQISNITRTQSPNINVSRLVLQLSLPNPMKPGVKLRMKM